VCGINDDQVVHRSPTFDDALIEVIEFGNGKKITGKKPFVSDKVHYVHFSFDDGPKLTTTPKVLDALEKYDVPATFFVVGYRFIGEKKRTLKRADLLRDIIDRGFGVGNHTYSHLNLAQIKDGTMKRQIDAGAAAIEEILGFTPYAFRPPYGAMSGKSRKHLSNRGYTEVRWSIDSQDFRADLTKGLRRRVVKELFEENGGMVLMHDTKVATAKSIGGILDDLEKENCRRLKANSKPIIPVSLHYFMRDENGEERPIPADARARTEQYVSALPDRCAARN
jgi:peptidoglycan/xylan/chitin deacetylase (PgdA/CDA1 family)